MKRPRVERAARLLGLGAGPQVPCRRCDGAGRDDAEARLEVHNAKFFGHPVPDDLPPPLPCRLCRGTGLASDSAVKRWESEAADVYAELERQLLDVGDRMATWWGDGEADEGDGEAEQ